MGYCGLDPRRTPLSGLEVHGCWEATTTGPTGSDDAAPGRLIAVGPGRRVPRQFVPVEELVGAAVTGDGAIGAPRGAEKTTPSGPATLFGDPEA